MFNPIATSQSIEQSFRAYIEASFSFADEEYARSFSKALAQKGQLAKGPYLEISGTYLSGASLTDLMVEGLVSKEFARLEKASETDKEIKLERPLYMHQEQSLRSAMAGRNIVVTTGTGSGKTECFLLPILNTLMQEKEGGRLTTGVRAIVIYPMNALASDQIKRIRKILKDYPAIKFGLYNGNTAYTKSEGQTEYRHAHKNPDGTAMEPIPNELLSREEMQNTPPHILITNYSMMEYMLLRPKDDGVFAGNHLKYLILDEAHIYRGAMGIETSLLLRRLNARISRHSQPQYILTSATLGTKTEDRLIVGFASKLCGVDFTEDDIIRANHVEAKIPEILAYPPGFFTAIVQRNAPLTDILRRYAIPQPPSGTDAEILYELCIRSDLYAHVRALCTMPIALETLLDMLKQKKDVSEEEMISAICAFSKAKKGNMFLLKARYHFFLRTLEGAYATAGKNKRVFLDRLNHTFEENEELAVFEIAVCTDCGRLALVGQVVGGTLQQKATRSSEQSLEYYVIKDEYDASWFGEDEVQASTVQEEDFIVCSKCAACASEVRNMQRVPCEHVLADYIGVHKARLTDGGRVKCPACGFGSYRRFYLGNDAATAVIGTALYEQLPEYEETFEAHPAQAGPSLFGISKQNTIRRTAKARQFLSFSDSRSEAAFFATYMESSYKEFLRRRGLWRMAEGLIHQGKRRLPVGEFAYELFRFFEINETFIEPYSREHLSADSRSNAWVALLNEMYNARRSTGLTWMGRLYFDFRKHTPELVAALSTSLSARNFQLSEKDTKALLELLAQDIVYSGALNAGADYRLTDAEREYIFYAPKEKSMVLSKNAETAGRHWVTGWAGRRRPTGTYYPNSRIERLKRVLGCDDGFANDFLEDYWRSVLELQPSDEFVLNANDLDIVLADKDTPFYKCDRCARVTPYNCKDQCISVKCDGRLMSFDAQGYFENNHFTRLYRNPSMSPLFIKEHTAQLSRDKQRQYQQDFLEKKLNVLSCSTTFEMGVDIGSLETIFLRNLPPSPANYVQRAGRAGRALDAAAFVVTFARLSSHDFAYYKNPIAMISGRISAPVFEIENEKIVNRHVYSVALSSFFLDYPEVYDNNDRSVFLNEGGYEKFCEYLRSFPDHAEKLLLQSIPASLHDRLGLTDNQWVEGLIGDNGVLSSAIQDYRNTINVMEKAILSARRRNDLEEAGQWTRKLREFRANKEDQKGRRLLIDYLVRNNVLPKYSFPVDTVELLEDPSAVGKRDKRAVQLARDLQIAIAEYSPGSEVIADGHMYKSRYVRKSTERGSFSGWEEGIYAECPNPACNQYNFVKHVTKRTVRPCVSCQQPIPAMSWRQTLEPRKGFFTDRTKLAVPMRRPERNYRSDDFYIGDSYHHPLNKFAFDVNGKLLVLESTSNDALVVIGNTKYCICPYCGYADEHNIPHPHKNAFGRLCDFSGETGMERRLAHDFRTDVVKVTFHDIGSADLDTMLSVLYAMLEGLSRVMGIERNDIKGCLHRVPVAGVLGFALILYDAVAGGAGHVRRMVTADGQAFKRVVARAFSIVDNCSCDSSCYQCLRNYYNQKIHDRLDRVAAADFLHAWKGNPIAWAVDEKWLAHKVEEGTN